MKKPISILLILLFAISSFAYAEQNTKISKKSKKNAKPEYEYSINQIDVALDKLPPKYVGNDPRKVYSSIEGRKKVVSKKEFETTELFTKRANENNRLPVIGNIGLDGFFAFSPTSNSIKFKYDADTSKFTVDVEMGSDFRNSGYIEQTHKSIKLYDEKLKESEYIGGNAFGATRKVRFNSSSSYDLLFDNYKKFYSPRLSDDAISREARAAKLYADRNSNFKPNYFDSDKIYELNATVNATPEEAKAIKEQIKALIVVKLKEPFSAIGNMYADATLDNPNSYSSEFKYLVTDVQEIWIYNIKTGEIYAKKKL